MWKSTKKWVLAAVDRCWKPWIYVTSGAVMGLTPKWNAVTVFLVTSQYIECFLDSKFYKHFAKLYLDFWNAHFIIDF